MVAAHNYDLAAARRRGWRRRSSRVRSNLARDRRPTSSRNSQWDVVAKSFEDLAARLGC